MNPALVHFLHGDGEPVPELRTRLDEACLRRRIAERAPELAHGGVQAVVEVNKHILGPQSRAEHLAGDQLSRVIEKEREDAERLRLKAKPEPVFAQIAALQIDFEVAEANAPRTAGSVHRTGRF